ALDTFGATNPGNAFGFQFWGTFIFAEANGTLEAVANPLVSTLFPQNPTHYLNILHYSSRARLVLGSVMGWILDDKMQVAWKTQLALFLIPTVLYGLMFMGQHMPKSEASVKGVSFGTMFKDVGILGSIVVCYLLSIFFSAMLGLTPNQSYMVAFVLLVVVTIITKGSLGYVLLFVLFLTHAIVGAVELGTDGWIQNITGNLFSSEDGKFLFMWTSAIMFTLRFCAGFIEKSLKLSPVGLLMLCAALASVGLNLSSGITTFAGALLALGIYAAGKTFFWPTMLAIVGDRFPRSGAVAISIMGGIGMLSGGLVGSAGLGYAKDRFAGETLNQSNPAVYAQAKAATPSAFLFFSEVTGLDGTKLGDAKAAPADKRTADQKAMVEADQQGDRKTLKADSALPATMAIIYLLLLLYFKGIGGYRALTIDEQK
ncbi:MAG: major facilitator superfamily 1, partial [Verrucomicrobiaceae bacterium]|nr:major facilitator superfamily 1 [Verrucomicrobiaceae bacterium]